MIPRNIAPMIDQIFKSDRPDIEKLGSAFHLIAGFQIENSKNECELFRATGDRESMVKEQIKHSTITHMVNIFAECYYRATGSPWDEEHNHD